MHRRGSAAERRRFAAGAWRSRSPALWLLIVVLVVATSGGGVRGCRCRGSVVPPKAGDPFAYVSSRQGDFEARAVAGSAHVLFTKSPGGVLATAARVAALRPSIDAATAGTGVDPNMLEALVFVESAGREQRDRRQRRRRRRRHRRRSSLRPASRCSGCTSTSPEAGADRRRSTRAARERPTSAAMARLQRQRAQDRRSLRPAQGARRDGALPPASPSSASAAPTWRSSPTTWGSATCSTCSTTTTAATRCRTFSSTSTRRRTTTPPRYHLLSGFGDDSSLYYWRILGAAQIMRLYRTDRTSAGPPVVAADERPTRPRRSSTRPTQTHSFADPDALYRAYASTAALAAALQCRDARAGLLARHRVARQAASARAEPPTAGYARPRSTC